MKSTRKQYSFVLSLVCFIIVSSVMRANADALKKNFYKKSCPQAEKVVRDTVWSIASSRSDLGAKLLRMHFHDCFVKGCDASILLDPVGSDDQPEKKAIPNQSVAGYEVIDEIKTKIEQACRGVVSCADILSLAARDAVSFPFKKDMWEVLTGRRDGNVSLASNVNGNLPSPFSDFNTLLQLFTKKGLNMNDLVVLSGAHTLGDAHCGGFSRRLYNFTGKGDADPSLNATYADTLRTQCLNPPVNVATTVEMDPQSSLEFDSHYYEILLQNKGLFQSDAALLTNGAAKKAVIGLQNTEKFISEFGKAMKKMGNVEVLTGSAGQIRKRCRFVN